MAGVDGHDEVPNGHGTVPYRQEHSTLCMQNAYNLLSNNSKLFIINALIWWRRRELNPRPKMLLVKRLHAYSRSCPRHYPRTFAAAAQNGQETPAASLRS